MRHFIKQKFNIAGKKKLTENNKNFNIAYGVGGGR